jgi:hypothetical protein
VETEPDTSCRGGVCERRVTPVDGIIFYSFGYTHFKGFVCLFRLK